MRRGGLTSWGLTSPGLMSCGLMSCGLMSFGLMSFGLAAVLTMGLAAAHAEPFKCPRVGGNFTFGQENPIYTLDQMSSSSGATRNVAMNIHESLMTRSENNRPIPELAETVTEAPDRLSYRFRLRPGIVFHNGKPMTSDDVVASFDRYANVGNQRRLLDNVDRWEAPDPATFVIYLKTVQPTFIEALSAFAAPIVIIPAELRDVPAMQLTRPIGTGPFEWVEMTAGGGVKLKRYDGYQPNRRFEQRTGFGGYKVACLDTVTFRIVPESASRVAGLKANELQGVEDIPVKALADLRKDKAVTSMTKRLLALGSHAYVLDGDNLRLGLNMDLGFTPEDRAENVRRVSEVAKLMVDAGLIVITALVSPFEVDRQRAKSIFDSSEFLEVFVDTPIDICRERDPKGLYKKSAAGKIPNFTGVGQDYERPISPDLILDGTLPINENVDRILKELM